jgi:hypothetical protein
VLPGALVAAAASLLAQSLMATPMPAMQTVKRIAKPLICMAFFFDDGLLRGSAVRSLHGLPGGIRTPFATAIGSRRSGRSTGRGRVERAAAAGVRPARSGKKKKHRSPGASTSQASAWLSGAHAASCMQATRLKDTSDADTDGDAAGVSLRHG